MRLDVEEVLYLLKVRGRGRVAWWFRVTGGEGNGDCTTGSTGYVTTFGGELGGCRGTRGG